MLLEANIKLVGSVPTRHSGMMRMTALKLTTNNYAAVSPQKLKRQF